MRLSSGPRNAVEAALSGARPDWDAALAGLETLRELRADVEAWRFADRAMRDAGLPLDHVADGDVSALAAWARSRGRDGAGPQLPWTPSSAPLGCPPPPVPLARKRTAPPFATSSRSSTRPLSRC